jgi:hypothetical protein
MIPKLFEKSDMLYKLLVESGCSIEYTGKQLRRFHLTSKIKKPLYIYIYTNDNGKFHASGRFVTGLELVQELQEVLSNAYECGVGFKVFDVEELIEVFPFIEDLSLERSKKETK